MDSSGVNAAAKKYQRLKSRKVIFGYRSNCSFCSNDLDKWNAMKVDFERSAQFWLPNCICAIVQTGDLGDGTFMEFKGYLVEHDKELQVHGKGILEHHFFVTQENDICGYQITIQFWYVNRSSFWLSETSICSSSAMNSGEVRLHSIFSSTFGCDRAKILYSNWTFGTVGLFSTINYSTLSDSTTFGFFLGFALFALGHLQENF